MMSYGTPASASSTFMWPGMRPATGWIANFTATLLFCNSCASSHTLCCAWPTAMP